jgi:hypothetical protein
MNVKNLLIGTALGLSFAFTTTAGDIYSQGTRYGELIKVSYKGEGKEKVFEGYLELPSGYIWKFNTLNGGVVKLLTAVVKVDYVQPYKEDPAFEGATTPYNAVKFKVIRKFHLKKIYKITREKLHKLFKEGYTYSHGFRCGRVQKVSFKTLKRGFLGFGKKKAFQVELALTNIKGLPAFDKEGKPMVWKAVLPIERSESGEIFENFGENNDEYGLHNLLIDLMGRYVCLEYVQREPDKEDVFNYRVVGVYEVRK